MKIIFFCVADCSDSVKIFFFCVADRSDSVKNFYFCVADRSNSMNFFQNSLAECSFGPRRPLVLGVRKTFHSRRLLRDAQAEGVRRLKGVTCSYYLTQFTLFTIHPETKRIKRIRRAHP